MLSQPYFSRVPPKSLDRNSFTDVMSVVKDLTVEDKMATLTAFTSRSIANAALHFAAPAQAWYITGGGRHNKTLMQMLAKDTGARIEPVEALGYDGDSLEAEAFAYLAVRSHRELPLTFSTTTGIKSGELAGGRFIHCQQ
jgi:anhydro-N-acetylmuramic acid kinase